ncbi:permease [Acetobacterium sp.]|uniref:permease n=1 Tax=Acetobacterium sp. TaxID=1872094 RepID=UPI003593687E
MTSIILYSMAGLALLISFSKDQEKSKKSLKIAWNQFIKLLPSVISIMLFIGITLAILDNEVISKLIGEQSGIAGVLIALVLGSVTLIPSFVAFPLGGALLNAGAGYPQVAALVSTVMAVGIITMPTEMKYFTKSLAIKRNVSTFIICVIFTIVIGVIM